VEQVIRDSRRADWEEAELKIAKMPLEGGVRGD